MNEFINQDFLTDNEVADQIKSVPAHFGAGYSVDLGFTTQASASLPSTAVAADGPIAITSGGCISSLSGVMIGDIIDLVNANSYCNVFVAGRSITSGPLLVGVQCSDSTASGTFTDPTSGLPSLTNRFSSGGYMVLGSGPATDATLGVFGSGTSGNYFLSGFCAIGAFQRPQRYARLYLGSGFGVMAGFTAGFISQLKTTGSGFGTSQQPLPQLPVNV